MNKRILTIAGLLIAIASYAQTREIEKKLDNLLASYFTASQPGCQLLVARHGQVIYQKATGSADLELNVPLSSNMIFNLASITKQFTAVAILQLQEKGKLSVYDSLQKYIPDFPSKGHKITIEHLLTHTSGIKDYLQLNYSARNMERWDFTPRELIDGFKTNEIYYPAEDVFIAILCNSDAIGIDELSANISAIAIGKPLQNDVKVAPEILEKYVGSYNLSIDTNRTITIQKANDRLIAIISPTQKPPLLFTSDTHFEFKNMLGISGDFVVEAGKVTKFYINQNGRYEWIKTK